MLGQAFRDLWTMDDDSGSSDVQWERVLEGVERELRAMKAECAAEAVRAKVKRNGDGRGYNPA